ncbi:ABC transporter permease [Mesorhizobium sp. CO1-1-8]|uniref:ABC transporter permease n=1 Tax=Mesorhizobium sp. CO1-1-8 TaxID=2876631 RepID=UPI001CD0BF20|nr:ABC transporter permease subunit [Mesorhizobium sp. CO1-1-8]MBZ9772241.1 ABC transporter permease subunit [Mesorhizobium sp. CO1-1-8]
MLEPFMNLFAPGGSLELLALSPPGWGGNLLMGLARSLEVAAGAYLVALVIGFLGAYGKLYGGALPRDFLQVYTTVVRAVPELVLILILYYAVPQAVNKVLVASGYERMVLPPLLVGTIVLGMVIGAYMTEILRGAIQSVPFGQLDAAKAFGMSPIQTAWRITFPQMMANAIPGMANLWLIATKDTALLAVIGFGELTLSTKQAAGATKAHFTFFAAAGVLYLIISILSGRVFARMERWARRGLAPIRGSGI